MRNFLGLLGKFAGRSHGHSRLGMPEAPNHTAFLEARMNCAFDIDAIWYYERLKWQARD